jgi:HSP20 family protein
MANAAIQRRQENGNLAQQKDQHQQQQQQQQQPATSYTPLVDVVETGEAYLFQADLPGAKAEDLDISYENGTLTIEARVGLRQPGDARHLWREYGVGHYYRSFSIETPVNVEGIQAELKHGVLNLYVPKAESARGRKIAVKAG